MKELANLRWSPKWVSHLGCVKGCLDFLGTKMSDAWLFGGTGHAFIINISEDSCPNGLEDDHAVRAGSLPGV